MFIVHRFCEIRIFDGCLSFEHFANTGEHADYFSASYMKNFIDWRGSKNEIYFEDFKTSRTFLFLHFTFLIRASNVVKTWCLILQVKKTFPTQLGKTPRITGTQGKNKQGDPILLLQFLNVLYMTDICAKFENNLDSTLFSRELP